MFTATIPDVLQLKEKKPQFLQIKAHTQVARIAICLVLENSTTNTHTKWGTPHFYAFERMSNTGRENDTNANSTVDASFV